MLWVERERGWEGKESSAIMDGEVAWDGIEGDDDTFNETDNSIVESVKPNPDWFILFINKLWGLFLHENVPQ